MTRTMLLATAGGLMAAAFATMPGALAQGQLEPPADTPGCPMAGLFRSWNQGNQATEITFINRLESQVAIYWVDFEGNWVQYATIPPHGQHRQPTYVGHAWVAWNVDTQDCVGNSGYFAKGDWGQTQTYHH